MSATRLMPDALYWAKSAKHFDGKTTIVQISTVFGEDPDYWTLAVIGTDQHYMPGEFDILGPVEPPQVSSFRPAAE